MSKKTQGTQLYCIDPTDDSVIKIPKVTSIDGVDSAIEQLDITGLEDDARDYDSGLASPGTATFGILTDPTTNHLRLHQLKQSGAKLKWAIGWSDGKNIDPTVDQATKEFILTAGRTWLTFTGHMNSFPFNFAQNAVVQSSIGIQISGDPVLVPKA